VGDWALAVKWRAPPSVCVPRDLQVKRGVSPGLGGVTQRRELCGWVNKWVAIRFRHGVKKRSCTGIENVKRSKLTKSVEGLG